MDEKKDIKLQPTSQIRIEPPKEFSIKKEEGVLKTGNVADVQPTVMMDTAQVSPQVGPVVEGVSPSIPEPGIMVKQPEALGTLFQILLVLSIILIFLSGWILLSQALHLPVPLLSK
jgi:hypothetical protein